MFIIFIGVQYSTAWEILPPGAGTDSSRVPALGKRFDLDGE